MNHYFTENRDLLTNERVLALEIFDIHFRFYSNNGLFSCDRVDDASITLLQSIPPLASSSTLLDLGCGYGTLGIVLAKVYGVTLTMADVNGIAVEYATKNAVHNGIQNFTALQSDCYTNISSKFDNIVLNPPIHAGKDIMYKMYEEAVLHLNPGGALHIVIQKKHGAESTIKNLGNIFAQVDILYRKKGCFVVRAAIDLS